MLLHSFHEQYVTKNISKQWRFWQIALKDRLWTDRKKENKTDNTRTLQELDCLFYKKFHDLERTFP